MSETVLLLVDPLELRHLFKGVRGQGLQEAREVADVAVLILQVNGDLFQGVLEGGQVFG